MTETARKVQIERKSSWWNQKSFVIKNGFQKLDFPITGNGFLRDSRNQSRIGKTAKIWDFTNFLNVPDLIAMKLKATNVEFRKQKVKILTSIYCFVRIKNRKSLRNHWELTIKVIMFETFFLWIIEKKWVLNHPKKKSPSSRCLFDIYESCPSIVSYPPLP